MNRQQNLNRCGCFKRSGKIKVLAALVGSVVAFGTAGSSNACDSVIDGTVVRSFVSPLGVGTYGIGMDNDGVHAWVNKRGNGPIQFTQIDLFGTEMSGTRANSPVAIPQGIVMDASGELWLIDRRSFERTVRHTTSGSITSTFDIGNLGNPNDLTMRNGNLYVVAPNNPGIHQYQPDGTYVGFLAIDSNALDSTFPATDAVTYDGTNFWVARGRLGQSKVYEVAPDGSVLSSFVFAPRLLGLGYDPVNNHLLATSGDAGDTIFVIGAVSCPIDFNCDGAVDVLDFFVFISLFDSDDLIADLDGSGSIDVLDFFAFITLFAAGCP